MFQQKIEILSTENHHLRHPLVRNGCVQRVAPIDPRCVSGGAFPLRNQPRFLRGVLYLLRGTCMHNLDPKPGANCGRRGFDSVYIFPGVGVQLQAPTVTSHRRQAATASSLSGPLPGNQAVVEMMIYQAPYTPGIYDISSTGGGLCVGSCQVACDAEVTVARQDLPLQRPLPCHEGARQRPT